MRTIATLALILALTPFVTARAAAEPIDWSGRTMPAGVRQSTLTVGNVTTRLLQAGNPRSREAVVFIHGNPGSSLEFAHLVSVAGRYGRAVAFDMPGFGKASKDPNFDYSVPGEAHFLAAAFQKLGISRVHLALHDFGGPFGLEWAKDHPDQLLSVVLLNTGVFENYYGHPYAYVYNVPGLGEAAMQDQTHDSFTVEMQAGNPRPLPQPLIDEIWDEYDSGTQSAALKLYRSFGGPDGADKMGKAQAAELRKRVRPALVIWGEADPYIPAYVAYEQSDAFPGAQVNLLDSAHWPFVDNVAKVDALVAPFWKHNVRVVLPKTRAARRRCATGRRGARDRSRRACRRRR